MNQATDTRATKPKKVTILSDIILSPQKGGIIPLPSVPSIAPSTNNKPIKDFAHLTNSNIKNHAILKRKPETGLITIVPAVEEPKKPRIEENDEEAVFNYMTGTYEKVISEESSGSLECIQLVADTKDEIKIEENSLLRENIPLFDIKDKRQSLEKAQCEEDKSKIDLATTHTIDLTDDDTGTTFNVNKNYFVENVLALRNAVELQALAKEKGDNKYSLQNVVLPNTVQEKVIAKKTVIEKPLSIGKVTSSKTNRVAEKAPVSFILPKFLTSSSIAGVKNLKQNNNQKLTLSSNITGLIVQEKIPKIGTHINAPVVTKLVTAKTFWPSQPSKPTNIVLGETSKSLQILQLKGTQNFIPFNTQTITKSIDPPQNASNNIMVSFPNSLQNATISLQNLNCQTCSYKGQSKRDLIFHIYDGHLKHNFELILVCKLCNFETKLLSVMEKHDLGHGNTNLEKVKGVNLSSYVEIKVRKKEQVVTSTNEIDNLKNDSSVETIELIDSDEEAPPNISKEIGRYRCFDCNYDTSMVKLLENHAIKHSESKFECPQHMNVSPNCLECQYKKCLLGLGTKRFQCGKCGYKTRKQRCFSIHTDEKFGGCAKEYLFSSDSESEGDEALNLKCFHCSFDPITMDSLINHAKIHFGGAFKCDIHLSQVYSKCNKCIYEAILKDLTKNISDGEKNWKNIGKPNVFNDNLGKNIVTQKNTHFLTSATKTSSIVEYKCFDCSFVGNTRSCLKNHAIKHYKQNFQCEIHPNIVLETCKKCSNFYCDKHLATENSIDCEKCLYFCIKKEIQKEISVCEICSFYTHDKKLFNRHKKTKQSCEIYKKEVKELNGDSVPENNIRRFSEEESANQKSVREKFKKIVGQKLADTNKTIFNFKCYDCDLQYMDRNSFEEHVKSHKNSTFRCEHPIFTKHCMKCLYQNVVERTLGRKTLICKYCKYCCNNLESLQNHLKTNLRCQGLNVKATKSKVFKCYDCNKELDSKLHLWNHSFLHKSHYTCADHKINKDINGCDKCFYSYIQKNMHPPKHKCVQCNDQVLRSELELKGHIEVRHRNSNFTCDLHPGIFVEQCDKCFYKYICFKTSVRPALICAACDNCKLFSWFDLQKHIRNTHAENLNIVSCYDHNNQSQFLNCSKCLFEKIVGDIRYDLYQCYDCNVKLQSRDKLEVHVRIMHEHSTFQCTEHDLGDIVAKCGMCIYESIVVRMKSII